MFIKYIIIIKVGIFKIKLIKNKLNQLIDLLIDFNQKKNGNNPNFIHKDKLIKNLLKFNLIMEI